MPKPSSGRKSGRKTPDVTYKVYGERVIRNGKIKTKVDNEAFKAIYQAPEGTRITVFYAGLGSAGTTDYVIRMRGSSTKVLEQVREEGEGYRRPHVIRSISDVKKHINPLAAKEITIHGRDFAVEARERKRQEREFEQWLKSQS